MMATMDGCLRCRFFETDGGGGGGDGFEVVADFPEEVGLGSGGGACGAARVLPGRAGFGEERSDACEVVGSLPAGGEGGGVGEGEGFDALEGLIDVELWIGHGSVMGICGFGWGFPSNNHRRATRKGAGGKIHLMAFLSEKPERPHDQRLEKPYFPQGNLCCMEVNLRMPPGLFPCRGWFSAAREVIPHCRHRKFPGKL